MQGGKGGVRCVGVAQAVTNRHDLVRYQGAGAHQRDGWSKLFFGMNCRHGATEGAEPMRRCRRCDVDTWKAFLCVLSVCSCFIP